jgi:hypothetical protein
VETDIGSWKWIYYIPNRTYVTFPGTFDNEEVLPNLRFAHEDVEDECEMARDCVAIVKTDNISTAILVDYLDLDMFKMSEGKETLIKIQNVTKDTNIDDTNAWDNIDTCCPNHEQTNTKELLKTINDTLARISCDIPAEYFLAEYVRKREPVILVNCTKDWLAQQEWSLEKLLHQNGGHLMWRTDFQSENSQFNEFESGSNLSGDLINRIIVNNGTIRIFDAIERLKHTLARKRGDKLETDKMHLFSDYEKPEPVPKDYYELAGQLTDYQWIIISQKDTGQGIAACF